MNKPFAIILDNSAISAPNINELIPGGSASDQRQFHRRSSQPARHRAALGQAAGRRSKVIEESTVGPQLGADLIHAGISRLRHRGDGW